MIVQKRGPDLLFVTQPDHARLSGRVTEGCAGLDENPRAASILLATREHDNGWREPDAAPLVDPATGQPFDFVTAPPAVRQGVWPRGVARLAHDPWAAALVAQHAIAVYDRYRPDSAWSGFFSRMEALRAEMLHASGGALHDLLADYRFVRLGDLVSLVFCTGWTDEQRSDAWTVSGADDAVVVTPYPFARAPIPVEVEARRLPAARFRSDDELREKLAAAEVTVLRGEVRGGG